MAYKFRLWRRVRIAPGLTVNLSKRGASVSAGVRGAHVTVGRRGVRKTVGIPGTGMFLSDQKSWKQLNGGLPPDARVRKVNRLAGLPANFNPVADALAVLAVLDRDRVRDLLPPRLIRSLDYWVARDLTFDDVPKFTGFLNKAQPYAHSAHSADVIERLSKILANASQDFSKGEDPEGKGAELVKELCRRLIAAERASPGAAQKLMDAARPAEAKLMDEAEARLTEPASGSDPYLEKIAPRQPPAPRSPAPPAAPPVPMTGLERSLAWFIGLIIAGWVFVSIVASAVHSG
jgi:hypothetical protein